MIFQFPKEQFSKRTKEKKNTEIPGQKKSLYLAPTIRTTDEKSTDWKQKTNLNEGRISRVHVNSLMHSFTQLFGQTFLSTYYVKGHYTRNKDRGVNTYQPKPRP